MKLHPYIKKNIQHKLFKNFFTLFSGSIIAQAIVYISTIFLTHLFTEDVFGVFILYSSLVILLKTISTFNYELAIILPKRNKDAINIFILSILISVFISFLLLVLIIIFKNRIITIFNIHKITYFIYFIPLSVLFVGVIASFDYWNNRMNNFKNISIGVISKSTTMSATQLITGVSTLNQIGLIPGMIFGQFTNILIVFKLSFKSIKKEIRHISTNRMLFMVSKYRDIPLFNTLITFTNTLSNELPVLFISKYFGLGSTGIYGLAIKIAKVPPGIIGQSISQVFFNEASSVYNSQGNLYQLIIKTYKKLFLIAITLFLFLFLFSYFIGYIFGDNWSDAQSYVQILLPWLFVMFLNSPISSLIVILNKQKTILFLDLILLISRFLALYLGYYYYNDIIVSLILFSIVGFIFNLIILIYFLTISKTPVNNKVYK